MTLQSEIPPDRMRQQGLPLAVRVLFVCGGIALLQPAEFAMFRADGRVRLDHFALFVAAVLLAGLANIAAHEFGHLAAAIILRLRVVSVAVLGMRIDRTADGGLALGLRPRRQHNAVQVALNLSSAALPLRFAVFALAGPLVNIGLAAYCYAMGRRVGLAPVDKAAWSAAVVMGAAMGVANLIPAGAVPSGATDGAMAAGWLLRPRQMRERMKSARLWERYSTHRASAIRGQVPDLADLRTLTDCADKQVASASAALLLAVAARTRRMDGEEALFVRLAESDALTPRVAGLLASTVAWRRALNLLGQIIEAHRRSDEHAHPGPEAVAEIAPLAELAVKRSPDEARPRYVLAMVSGLQDRQEEGRRPLVGVSYDSPAAVDRANSLFVRALIELGLGDLAQAKRLARSAQEGNLDSGLLKLLQVVISSTEARQVRIAQGEGDPG